MTSTLAQGADRSPEPSPRLPGLAASPALLLLLGLALLLRLVIAYVLFPSSGFVTDISSYVAWALTLAAHGPAGFYANAGFSDYPPAYLYLLWPIGQIAAASGDPQAVAEGLVKVPPILLDLMVGYVIYRLALGWAWPGRRAETLGFLAAALYLFNPVVLYDSALWGQSDAAGALVLLLGAAALIRGNSEGAAVLAATAALVKPQFGVVLIPLVVVVLAKRHLLRPGSGPRHRPWAPEPLASWLGREQGWPRLLTALAASLLAFFVLALPFGLGIVEYARLMADTAGGYAALSVNAFNAWALVGSGGTPPLAESLRWSDDTVPLLGPLPGVVIGAVLLLAGFLWGVARAAARDDRLTLLMAITFLAIGFFILPTRVHERYIFPALAFMPLLAVISGRWTLALVLVSIGAFINLHAILTVDIYGTENVTSLPFGALFRTPAWIVASALLQTGVGLWAALQLRPSLRTSPDAFERAAADHGVTAPGAWLRGPVAVSAASTATPPPGAPSWDPAVTSRYPSEPPAPAAAEWVRGPSALDWIMDRLTRPPIRRDRSAELVGERGGRIDRLDVLVVVVLVLGAATLRGFNLGQPYGMYFDEVYHARTATEFLQDWQYGMPHDIYEFTHPHLAKYAMAWGIRLAGGNNVIGSADLGTSVVGATLERRWGDGTGSRRGGDRLYIGNGDELRVYDLATRALVDRYPVRAAALAVDDAAHRLYVADPEGGLFVLDTTVLDARRAGLGAPGGLEAFSAGPGQPVRQLVVTDASLIAVAADGSIWSRDTETRQPLSQAPAGSVEDVVALPRTDRVVIDTRQVRAADRLAQRLGDALGTDPGVIGELLASGHPTVVAGAYLDDEQRAAVEALVSDDRLAGLSLQSGPMLAVAGEDGISVLDGMTLDTVETSISTSPTSSLVLVERGLSEPTLYGTAGASLEAIPFNETDGPGLPQTIPMPGAVHDIAWNEPANLVHVLGEAPGGGPTVYVVEPHGNAVFIDVPLPLDPAFLLADTQPERPQDDRGELLAVASDGAVASVGIEGNAFGWRLPGMLLGALAVGLLYLLARVLFARRSIGLIAAILLLAEGMAFANSRIAMNDVYVATFVVAAALVFAPLYVAPRRALTAIVALLAAGVLLGLALASKWVALYAMGGLVLLVLLRSGLGRVIALVSMMSMTAVLGALAIRPAAVEDPNRNWLFVLLMLLLTGLLAAAMARRPTPITRAEARLAMVGPVVIGLGLLVLAAVRQLSQSGLDPGSASDGLLSAPRLALAGGLSIAVGVVVAIATWIAGRAGMGPYGGTSPPEDESTSGWLRPGWRAGLPWLFTLAALVLVPVLVYVVSYAPWVELGNRWGLPFIGNLPFMPSGHGGQTLPELTRAMYDYHNNLRAEHAASSPWWAWPFDLKPVWFYQGRFAEAMTGLIYDSGNIVVFWLGIPAMAFSAWTAWRRRSAALALVVVLWAAIWLPWARIDRATFQYHVYASLPFLILGLAYFLAELWHGPSPRVWFLARVSAAVALLGVPILWLLRTPLCIVADTAVANPNGVACAAEVTRTAQISPAFIASMVVVVVGSGLVGLIGWWASTLPPPIVPGGGRRRSLALGALVLVAGLTLVGVVAAATFFDRDTTTPLTLSSDVLALLAMVVLGIPAWMAIRARDARRYVLGVLVITVLWLLVWYPNIAGMPLPSDLAYLFQGLLPTWNWDFQFATNIDPPVGGGLVDLTTLVLGALSIVITIGAYLAARMWGQRDVPASSNATPLDGSTGTTAPPRSGGSV